MFAWVLVIVPASWALAHATGQQSPWTFRMAAAAIVSMHEAERIAAQVGGWIEPDIATELANPQM